MDELWNAWSAGFFDGEGCVRIFSGNNRQTQNGKLYVYKRYTVRLIVGQKDRTPLDRLVLHYGGSITYIKKTETYHWQINGANAIACLRKWLPYLTVKLAQANVALEYWEARETLLDEEKDTYVDVMAGLKTMYKTPGNRYLNGEPTPTMRDVS